MSTSRSDARPSAGMPDPPVGSTDPLVQEARDLAYQLLSGTVERWRHSSGVAERAAALATAVPRAHRPALVAAAWLHDIGYATAVQQTGFHPVDGARFLRGAGWPPLVCELVAHHSGSRFVAVFRDREAELSEFAFAEDPVSDALAAADQTVGPGGVSMTLPERMDDVLRRHGPDSPNALAHSRRQPYLLAAGRRVAARLPATESAVALLPLLDASAGSAKPSSRE